MCRSYIYALVVCVTLALSSSGHTESVPRSGLDVVATVLILPKSPPCLERTVSVTVRYRVDGVIRASTVPAEVLVRHVCPSRTRGWTRRARGDAPRMRPGDRHHLLLQREDEPPRPSSRHHIVDPFDADLPRYIAQSTNRAPWPPRMIVTVTGNGGTNHRITFDKRQVIVGSNPAADVFLDHEAISPTHLRLISNNKTVIIHGRATIDGKPLRKPTAVNYRSRIVVGPYLLNIVLLTKPWFPNSR